MKLKLIAILLLISTSAFASPCLKSEDQKSVICTAEGFRLLIAAEIKTKAAFDLCGVDLRSADAKLKAAGERIGVLEAAVVGEEPPIAWIAAGSFAGGLLIALAIFFAAK